MSQYDDLWQAIEMRVRQNNGASLTDISHSESILGNQVRQRTAQIFILEIILDKHRKQFATRYTPLSGDEALHHLVFTRTNWLPAQIRTLLLSDALFVIADMFRDGNIPQGARDFLSTKGLRNYSYPQDEFTDRDWAPKENEVHLSDP
ncbi:ECs1072 family phage-associated protein [Erwinia amylovora]